MSRPNTFLIGVQKAATTSVFNWLGEHPEICAPLAMKDLEFFTRPSFYEEKGVGFLLKHYENCKKYQRIKIQGSVHYIFFEDALKRIKSFNPEAKFILILRQPVERAISGYKYAIKFNYENLSFKDAVEKEAQRIQSEDLRIISECTYVSHGYYAYQIKRFLKYFKKSQLKIILYEDVTDSPEKITKELYKFLGVNPEFKPEFTAYNKTGSLKSKTLQKFFFGDHWIKKTLVRMISSIISEEKMAKLRWKIIHMNTSNKEGKHKISKDLIDRLNANFEADITELEQLIDRDLSHWKQQITIK